MLLLAATATLLPSCHKDDLKTDYSMYKGEFRTIEGKDAVGKEWDSVNEYVATVENGIIKGKYVGKTTINCTNDDKIGPLYVEVTPRYTLYEDPCTDWGISKDEIKKKYGTPASEVEDGIIYYTDNLNVPFVAYTFKDGKLANCGVVCNLTAESDAINFLSERYESLLGWDEEKHSAMFIRYFGKIANPDIDFVVLMQPFASSSMQALLIAYTPLNLSGDEATRSLDNFDNSEMIKVVKELLK